MASRMTRDEVAEGVRRYRFTTSRIRSVGMSATAYLVDDVLVDTANAHVRPLVIRAFENRTIRAICCTHNHEDHTGNAGVLAERHACPVYLRNARRWRDEGVADMPAYRRFYWGEPADMEPVEMPTKVVTSGRVLRAVPTPGHSRTHTAFFDPESKVVFTGDLFVAPGAAAVMRHEDPYEIAQSLRRVADLEPSLMLTGHAVSFEAPADALRRKARHIEEAAREIIEMRELGSPIGVIAMRVFQGGWKRDRTFAVISGREFSRTNFVRAVLARWPR